MSRSHARIVTKIWTDRNWRGLNAAAQWLYFTILSQPDLTQAGTISFNPSKWSKLATGATAENIESWTRELADARFVILDDYTDELMVRSFLRNDGVAKQPKVLISACRTAVAVQSELIRAELAFELSRIDMLKYPPTLEALKGTVSELAPDGVPGESPTGGQKGLIRDPERVNQFARYPEGAYLQNPKWKGLISLPETPGGGGGGIGSSKSKGSSAPQKAREEENPNFQAFCDAYPKPIPASQRFEVRERWKLAADERGTARVLKAAQRYAATFEDHETKFAKSPAVWFKDDLFVEHLPDELEPWRGMDVVGWLDEVTARRDIGTAIRYATGDTFLPQWPAEYEGWTKAEADAFRETDKDRWFREHRQMHLDVLQARYGGDTHAA